MTKQTDDKMARLDAAIERLETLGLTGPVISPTAVNPDGSPGHVAPGELIESSWGNAVSDEFQRARAVYQQVTTSPTFGTAQTFFPGLSVTVTFHTTRLYRLSANVSSGISTLAGITWLYITNSAGVPWATTMHTMADGDNIGLTASTILTGVSGSTDVMVAMKRQAGTYAVQGASGRGSYILVEEISPSQF